MLPADVHRISIDKDEAWESYFIPWLEDLERKGVGVEDGVFVATIDPSLRILHREGEECFVKSCAENLLTSVVRQKFKKFTSNGLYHLGAELKQKKHCKIFKRFKKAAGQLSFYKESTCCTQILQQENGLEKLLSHFQSNGIDKVSYQATSCDSAKMSSIVLLEEMGLQIRESEEKGLKNIERFKWGDGLNLPPKKCPGLECIEITDDEESDFSNEESDFRDEERDTTSSGSEEESTEEEAETGVLYGHGLDEKNNEIKITANLNFSRIFNILWLLPNFYPGFHSSYLYFGEAHSSFPVHVEDALTFGLNYLHVGHPKIWVIIPPWATSLLDFHLHKGGLYLGHSHCRNLLGHKVFLPTIAWLKERRIPFKIVIQRPGDLMVLYPNAAHFGFNLGRNIAQAVNIATKSWLPWGINAMRCICMQKQIHLNVLPLVAAFRKDLLPKAIRGDVVVTPASLRGIQLLHTELARIHGNKRNEVDSAKMKNVKAKRMKNEEQTVNIVSKTKPNEKDDTQIPCPAPMCSKMFCKIMDGKSAVIHHVKSSHKPILEKCQLLKHIEDQFKKEC